MRGQFAFAVALFCVPCCATAADEGNQTKMMQSLMESMGFKQSNDIRANGCKIVIDAKQSDVLDAVPLLQKIGVLNEDMTKTELLKAPTKTAMAIAIQFAPIEIKIVYDNNADADKCAFVHNLISNDDYGNDRKEPMFAYAFDRATYKKINWDNFKSQNLSKVAKNFVFNPEVVRRMADE